MTRQLVYWCIYVCHFSETQDRQIQIHTHTHTPGVICTKVLCLIRRHYNQLYFYKRIEVKVSNLPKHRGIMAPLHIFFSFCFCFAGGGILYYTYVTAVPLYHTHTKGPLICLSESLHYITAHRSHTKEPWQPAKCIQHIFLH